eukprot:6595990-Alexandrium_andersonii.AAC.1
MVGQFAEGTLSLPKQPLRLQRSWPWDRVLAPQPPVPVSAGAYAFDCATCGAAISAQGRPESSGAAWPNV